jgi:flagellar hook-associated protein FlgK
MDANVRQEFQRKDQAIHSLSNNLEAQLRSINGWIRQEEMARTQQEVNLRAEVAKINDAVRYELDNFKNN